MVFKGQHLQLGYFPKQENSYHTQLSKHHGVSTTCKLLGYSFRSKKKKKKKHMIQPLTFGSAVQKEERTGIQGNSGWREQTRARGGKDNDFELKSS